MGIEKLVIKNLSKSFNNQRILHKLDLKINSKEHFFILGHSGAGKSVLLSIIGGFISPDSGQVLLNKQDITNLPVHKRPFNTVFQNYALFPHLNVFQNIAFGLKIKKKNKNDIEKQVTEALQTVNLVGFGQRTINQLSGGEQQRVAIARALVNHPEILLLDEPMSALDAKLKEQMTKDLKSIKEQMDTTFIHVTHDQKIALELADRIAIIKDGKILQVDTPQNIYHYPINQYVANFIGKMNFLTPKYITELEEGYIGELDNQEKIKIEKVKINKSSNYEIAFRPEVLKIYSTIENIPNKVSNRLNGKIENIVFGGASSDIYVKTQYGEIVAKSANNERYLSKIDSQVVIAWLPEDTLLVEKQ